MSELSEIRSSLKIEKYEIALDILKGLIPLHNDLDAYLHDIIDWALHNAKKPDPKDFGL